MFSIWPGALDYAKWGHFYPILYECVSRTKGGTGLVKGPHPWIAKIGIPAKFVANKSLSSGMSALSNTYLKLWSVKWEPWEC